jgi:hypothetical protein
MPRRATGQVVVDERRKSPTFALRFRAEGQRHYKRLGTAEEGWTLRSAEQELEKVQAEVRLGIWRPPQPEVVPEPESDPNFRVYASRWFEANEGSWRPKTCQSYRWQLSHHLLPFFQDHRLSQITVAEVDRYRWAKVKESARLTAAQGDWKGQRDKADRVEDRARRGDLIRNLTRTRPPQPLSARHYQPDPCHPFDDLADGR